MLSSYPSSSETESNSGSLSLSESLSQSPSVSDSNSYSETPSLSVTPSETALASISETSSISESSMPSQSSTETISDSRTASRSLSSSPSVSTIQPPSMKPVESPLPSPSQLRSSSRSSEQTPELLATPTSSPTTSNYSSPTIRNSRNCVEDTGSVILVDNDLLMSSGFPLCSRTEDRVDALLLAARLTDRPSLMSVATRNEFNATGQQLLSQILDIVLEDDQGIITRLDSDLTICLRQENGTKKTERRACLSYYDERKGKWICEDSCLATTKDGLLCGKTGHLTNFALLLTGGSNLDSCQSDPDNTISWISMGMIVGACVIIAFFVFLNEIRVRYYQYRQAALLKQLFANQLRCVV